MKEIDITSPQLLNAVNSVLQSEQPVFMLELPSVFALVAPPTVGGVDAMNFAKQRLPGKLYGSAIGVARNFFNLAQPAALPDMFADGAANIDFLEGAFIRLMVGDSGLNTSAIRNGTHQGLLLPDGPLRSLFKAIEHASYALGDTAIFPTGNYKAPLCTSANISGDLAGSITEYKAAKLFGDSQGIALLVRSSEAAIDKGSYPIFSFYGNRVSIERKGPGWERMLESMPSTVEIIKS